MCKNTKVTTSDYLSYCDFDSTLKWFWSQPAGNVKFERTQETSCRNFVGIEYAARAALGTFWLALPFSREKRIGIKFY